MSNPITDTTTLGELRELLREHGVVKLTMELSLTPSGEVRWLATGTIKHDPKSDWRGDMDLAVVHGDGLLLAEAIADLFVGIQRTRRIPSVAEKIFGPVSTTTTQVCKSCGDSHQMWMTNLERMVPCTQCPYPCVECAASNGRGAFCTDTPCPCTCHTKKVT